MMTRTAASIASGVIKVLPGGFPKNVTLRSPQAVLRVQVAPLVA